MTLKSGVARKKQCPHFHSSVSACLYYEHAFCHKDIISYFFLLFDVTSSVNVFIFKEAHSCKLVRILLCCLLVNKGGKIVVNVDRLGANKLQIIANDPFHFVFNGQKCYFSI